MRVLLVALGHVRVKGLVRYCSCAVSFSVDGLAVGRWLWTHCSFGAVYPALRSLFERIVFGRKLVRVH